MHSTTARLQTAVLFYYTSTSSDLFERKYLGFKVLVTFYEYLEKEGNG
jgi:hypothetical protein